MDQKKPKPTPKKPSPKPSPQHAFGQFTIPKDVRIKDTAKVHDE